jgi:hypothetical protein
MAEQAGGGRAPSVAAPRLAVPRRAALRPAPGVRVGLDQLVVGVLSLVAWRVAFERRADFDFWWHLAVGRYVAAERALPVPDPFSWSAAGRDWTAHEWLLELTMYGLHRAFGMAGPAAAFALCAVLALWVLAATLRGLGTRMAPAALVLLLALVAWTPYLGPRPNVVSTLLLACELGLLERWVRRRDRSIAALPLLLWGWANLHGSFAVGVGVAALLLGSELLAAALRWERAARLDARARRRLAAALGAGLLLVPLNANGIRLLTFPLGALGDPSLNAVQEWQPLDVTSSSAAGFVALLGLWLALALTRRPRVPLSDLALAGGLALATLSSQRFQPFAALVLALAIGRVPVLPNESAARAPRWLAALGRWRDERARRFAALGAGATVVNALVLALTGAALLWDARAYDVRADERMPVAALDTLGARGLPGPLFNEFGWGGYVTWRLWPDARVFIDGRQHDLYIAGPEFEDYLEVVRLEAGAERVLQERGVRTVLFESDAPLSRYLTASGRWRTTYDDGIAIVLERIAP